MAPMAKALLLLALAASQAVAQNAKTTRELFEVDFSTNARGGCQYVGETAMDSYVADSLTLALSGVQLMNDYANGGNPEAERLVHALFKGSRRTDRTRVRESFEAVRDFLQGSRTLPDGKPFLFCNSNWLQRWTMNDPVRDPRGNPIPNPNTGGPVLIRDVPDLAQQQRDATRALRMQAFPYWSLKHNQYLFDQGYPNPAVGYCSDPQNQGVTQDIILPPSITLCEIVFDVRRGIRGVQPNPLRKQDVDAGRVNSAQQIGDVLPTATTLFHELFHLVLGSWDTKPPSGEQYRFSDAIRLTVATSAQNPESFAFAAVAYDYTMNAGEVGGFRVEFYTGYTTQG
ncbi:hypothetical protein DL767_006900 [Monosporascus sp. MG133]|nr:hypothetical protein DL767_006900 [Monosporascus sp. MG133]